jgi:hypothetical protein
MQSDPENSTLNLSMRCSVTMEIEDYVDQQANSSVDYAYSFRCKPF